MDDKKIAVLIDAENVSGKYIKLILDEVSNYGSATYKRLYGDFQTPSVRAWMKNLRDYAITPVFQYNYTQGKNASDSALIIDAMDILYSGNVDGFCIVTSDSDFTKLVLRLRESGMTVIGMGERKTPNAFVSACETFKFLDILLNDEIRRRIRPCRRRARRVRRMVPEKRQRKKAIRMQSAIFRTWRRWRKRLSRSSTHMRTMTDGWIYRSWETIFQSVCRDLTREIINARS